MNYNTLTALSAVSLSAVSLFVCHSAQAAVIIQANSLTSNASDFGGTTPSQAIDQTGLNSNYVSGVTDFDTFVPATTHISGPGTSETTAWFGSPTNWTADFDLGENFTLDRLAIWNPQTSLSLRQFTLIISETSDFSSSTNLGVINLNNGQDVGGTVSAQTFTFTPTIGRYVRFQNATSFNAATGFAEVAFGGEIIPNAPDNPTTPEPSTILGLLAVGSLGAFARKRKG